MTEEEQNKIIAMGREAQALQTNSALEAVFSSTLEDLFSRWCGTASEDTAERMAIWSTAQALREFKNTLDAFVATGKLEETNREFDRNNK